MTKGDVAKLLAVLAASYPKFEVDDLKVQVWHDMLGDLDYKIADMAIRKLILQNTFPPAIAEVRKAAAEITSPKEITDAEAWGEVLYAIRRYGYLNERDALASMSPRVAQVVKWMGWREICECEEAGVIRGQFVRLYQQAAERERQDKLLPEALIDQIQMIANRMDIKAIEGGMINGKALDERTG